jgi:hypothetical protein
MFHRSLKKNVGGKWEPIKWASVKVGDIIRIYDKGMLSSDLNVKVLAPCGVVEIGGAWYKELLTDAGKINSKGLLGPQAGIRNPHKKKHCSRPKKVLK